MVTGPFLGTYSAKFIMQQCKKMNSLDQILTTVVNLGHLMDFAGSVPVYIKKQMEVFSFFTPYHHHVYFLLLLVFLCNWHSFLKEILCLPVFFPQWCCWPCVSCSAGQRCGLLPSFGMHCLSLPLPPPSPLCGADGVNSHGGSWCSWGLFPDASTVSWKLPVVFLEKSTHSWLLFFVYDFWDPIRIIFLFAVLFYLPSQPVPKIFGLKPAATWGTLLFSLLLLIIFFLHSYRHLSPTCLPL